MMQANDIYLTKRCELSFNGVNVWAPVATCSVNELEEAMNSNCADSVVVHFRTRDEYKSADIVKFTKRLDTVSGWTFSQWEHPVVNGFTNACKLQCVATRSP